MEAAAGAKPTLLEWLPPEIITSILDCLVPQPPEIGETRPVSYDKLVPGEPWFDFTRSRRGLWSLCLTSRRFAAVAQPLLYRVIAILDEDGLILLFRTLAERPAFGPWTRYLSVHLTLSRESVIRETRRAIGRLLRTFRPVAAGAAPSAPAVLVEPIRHAIAVLTHGLPVLSTSAGDFDTVPQVILAYILRFLARLETLMLQVPICDDHPEYTALFERLAEAAAHFAGSDAPPELIPFCHVSTLLLQGDPELLAHFESDECDCEIPEVWGSQARRYAPLFARFPRLATLEVSTDDGAWSNVLDEHPLFLQGGAAAPPYLGSIRHLYLHNSIACPRNLHQVLRNAPALQTLYMTPRRDDAFYRGPPEDATYAHPEALDVALERHAHNLRHLDVAWFDVIGFESLIGPDGRLASLPTLVQLEKLCVQLAVLYGTSPMAALATPLVDLLPPNLVELTLEDWWWSSLDAYDDMADWGAQQKLAHYRSQHEYRRTATRMLEEFATGFRHRMPRLKKVLLLCQIPWTWMVERGVDLSFHFEATRQLFKDQNVDFAVEEM